jgi:hypothetical protein
MAAQDVQTNTPVPSEESAPKGGGNSALRFYWMAVGNLALLTAAGLISKQPVWTVTLMDAGYVFIVVTLFLARYFDITRYGGETTNGEPASNQHLVRYGLGLASFAAALWGLVQAVDV